jgi:hypothetical protein
MRRGTTRDAIRRAMPEQTSRHQLDPPTLPRVDGHQRAGGALSYQSCPIESGAAGMLPLGRRALGALASLSPKGALCPSKTS